MASHRVTRSGLSLRAKIGCSSLLFMGGPPYATRHRETAYCRLQTYLRVERGDRRGHRGVVRDVRAVGRVGARRVADVGAVVVELAKVGRKGSDWLRVVTGLLPSAYERETRSFDDPSMILR